MKECFAKREELLRGKMNIGLKKRKVKFFIWGAVRIGNLR